jgi:hypothetical protein
MAGLAIVLMSSLLALEGAAEPVRLVPFQCAGVSDGDVRGPLRVELRDQLLEGSAPTPATAAVVAVTCSHTDLLLSVAMAGRTSPPVRRLALGEVRPEVRPRAIALSIVELLRGAPPAVDHHEPAAPAPMLAAPPPPPSTWRENQSLHIAGRWMKLPHDLDAFTAGFGWAATFRERWFATETLSLGTLTDANKMGRNDGGIALDAEFGRSGPLYTRSSWAVSWALSGGLAVASFEPDQDTGNTLVVGPTAGISLFVDHGDPCQGFAPRHGSMAALQLLYVHWMGRVDGQGVGASGWGFMASLVVGLAH